MRGANMMEGEDLPIIREKMKDITRGFDCIIYYRRTQMAASFDMLQEEAPPPTVRAEKRIFELVRNRAGKHRLTDSIGEPFASDPRAIAHQKMHVEGSMIPTVVEILSGALVPNFPAPAKPYTAPCFSRVAGATISFTIVSRMLLAVT